MQVSVPRSDAPGRLDLAQQRSDPTGHRSLVPVHLSVGDPELLRARARQAELRQCGAEFGPADACEPFRRDEGALRMGQLTIGDRHYVYVYAEGRQEGHGAAEPQHLIVRVGGHDDDRPVGQAHGGQTAQAVPGHPQRFGCARGVDGVGSGLPEIAAHTVSPPRTRRVPSSASLRSA
ncbi:hypothetical protein Srufu_008110 [Streptomyces libani subsp. rufus]|nr:hypothetical protein Srufu_008110 [Streptomyces libani subsp. rufus]